ncbi:MAG: FABP family protein [Pseudolysinimonas sp.]
MFDFDAGLPAEIVPLAWLLGVWEGTGVLSYRVGDDVREAEFGMRLAFTHDGAPYVQYTCSAWLLDGEGDSTSTTPLYSELGYWRLSRPLGDGDPGPGMLPRTSEAVYTTADAVETLRNARGGFDLEVSIVQPGGVSEVYVGEVNGPRIDLATDAVMRTAGAKDYAAATRLYGLVDEHLLWAWDIAALGQDLRTHSSGRLARVG